ncbi:hypothetical protein BGZ96_000690 [Linnemannia gamsii]|uniref:Uncharacterized protein n=1 Tax=Linnemannia gamsii TaxID=64522 RepID=A0ABQ7KIH6_9FUNG|nr:hypothetical protein BGZ96_000690 [Linnemannia gamsii]
MSTAVEPTSQIHTTESMVSDITPGTNTPTSSDTSTLIQEQTQEQQTQDEDDIAKDQNAPEHTKTSTATAATTAAAVNVPQADLDAELTFCKDRLETIEKEERTGADPEKVALEELEKSTRTLISVREQLASKQEQLDDTDNTDRDGVQAEIDTLAKESSEKEHQWSATKEVYHREFGAIVEDTSKPVTVVKAKAELDIKMLQDQIASLQKQLDAVSLKRKEMVADAAEQHRKLVERNGGGVDDE